MALRDHNGIGSDGAFRMAPRGAVGSLGVDSGNRYGSNGELVVAFFIYGIRYDAKPTLPSIACGYAEHLLLSNAGLASMRFRSVNRPESLLSSSVRVSVSSASSHNVPCL